mgnify:CR=1 FL=1
MIDTHLPATSKATTIKKMFSRKTSVTIDIAASPETIWRLLTIAQRFKTWNTTIIDITGTIGPGEKIELRSTLAPKRIFKLKVKVFEPHSQLSWGDAMGTRIFTLTPNQQGGTRFTMTEKISGPFFLLFAKMIPPFDNAFDQFASDLKIAAEEVPLLTDFVEK